MLKSSLYQIEVSLGGKHRLGPVSLSFSSGERIALIGPNGSGKSTLLKVIVGFLRPIRGEVRFARGRDVVDRTSIRFGYVPQSLDLLDHLSAADHLSRSLDIRHESIGERNSIFECLQMIGLGNLAQSRAGEMSGGERQRLAIARAVHNRAEYLLLDEPTSALDQSAVTGLSELLTNELSSELIQACATHDARFAKAYATRFLLLKDGNITSDLPAEEVTSLTIIENAIKN